VGQYSAAPFVPGGGSGYVDGSEAEWANEYSFHRHDKGGGYADVDDAAAAITPADPVGGGGQDATDMRQPIDDSACGW